MIPLYLARRRYWPLTALVARAWLRIIWRPVAGILVFIACGIAVAWCTWALSGCAYRDQLVVLTAMTEAAALAQPALHAKREADGRECTATGATNESAHECLERVRRQWEAVWLALDTLEELDRQALEAPVELGTVLEVYCALIREAAERGVPIKGPPEGWVCP